MAKNYMLITVEDREIMTEQFDTREEAQRVMQGEMVWWGGVPQVVFDEHPEEYSGKDFGYSAYGGFASGKNGEQLDWSIVAL